MAKLDKLDVLLIIQQVIDEAERLYQTKQVAGYPGPLLKAAVENLIEEEVHADPIP